jgi:hypothetical protein
LASPVLLGSQPCGWFVRSHVGFGLSSRRVEGLFESICPPISLLEPSAAANGRVDWRPRRPRHWRVRYSSDRRKAVIHCMTPLPKNLTAKYPQVVFSSKYLARSWSISGMSIGQHLVQYCTPDWPMWYPANSEWWYNVPCSSGSPLINVMTAATGGSANAIPSDAPPASAAPRPGTQADA